MDRQILAVEAEFVRMLAGAKQTFKTRAAALDPTLLPFDIKVVGLLWQHRTYEEGELGLTSRDISEIMESDKSMVSRSLKRLEDVDFVRRETDPNDARAQRIHLTQQAADRYRDTGTNQRAVVHDRLVTWDVDQVHQLALLLYKLNGSGPEDAVTPFPLGPAQKR